MTHGDLNPHAILHTLGLTEATAITPVYGGSDTAIWQVEQAGAVYALRVFGEGEHRDCEREQMVMQAAFALARIHQWTMRWKKRAGCPQVEKDASV